MKPIAEQRRERLIHVADEILEEIDRLLATPKPSREEDLGDRNLDWARQRTLELRERLSSGRLPRQWDRRAVMTRIILDQWPLGTRLGNEISKLESAYRLI